LTIKEKYGFLGKLLARFGVTTWHRNENLITSSWLPALLMKGRGIVRKIDFSSHNPPYGRIRVQESQRSEIISTALNADRG
jgi:hypothetical protein